MRTWHKLSLLSFMLLFACCSQAAVPNTVPDKQHHKQTGHKKHKHRHKKYKKETKKETKKEIKAVAALPEPQEDRPENHSSAALQDIPTKQEEAENAAVHLGTGPYGYYNPARFAHGITVTTSPLMGVKSAFDASDLLYQYPSMNEDLLLLRQREFLQERLLSVGDTLDNRAIVVLSGGVEGEIIFNRGFNGRSNGDVNLSTTELDVTPVVGSWTNGFFAFDFDSAPAATGNRVENSRIFLSRGYITIGNLLAVPIYMTIGQMYLPFGRYSSAMLTTPLTKSVARIQGRAALLGYYKDGLYAELYGSQGFTTSGVGYTFKEGGVNAGYQTSDIDFGVGYVTNIANSQGMQDNGLSPFSTSYVPPNNLQQINLVQFGGFALTPGGNSLIHAVPAVDGHLEANYGPWSLLTEFITTTEQFAPQDMTFNGNPARVRVMHLETDFTMHLHDRPILLALVYGQSWEALAMSVPKNSYAAVISTSIWKNTTTGIEYRHDVNYGKTALSAVTGHGLPVPSANIAGTRNLITINFGAFF